MELLSRADRVNFHAPVSEVLDITVQAERLGGMLDKVAESNPLNAAANEVPAGMFEGQIYLPNGVPSGIRTHGIRNHNPTLYQAEL